MTLDELNEQQRIYYQQQYNAVNRKLRKRVWIGIIIFTVALWSAIITLIS